MVQTTMFYSQNPEKHYTMSKLLVFGPSSFPLLTTKSGAVVMAGGYYGAGRGVLLPHELLLANTALMVGSALWVSGRDSLIDGGDQWKRLITRFVMDPNSKAWSRLENDWSYTKVGRRAMPQHDCQFVSRDNLLKENPPFYVTEAHYEDNSEALLEYVRNGGGLIVGGHSWWWNEVSNPGHLSCLLHHPGNRFLTEFGLALSPECVDTRDAKFPIKTAEIPSLKQSFYFFARMRAKGTQYRKHDEDLYNEFYQHMKEMEKMEKFQDIVRLNKIHFQSFQKQLD